MITAASSYTDLEQRIKQEIEKTRTAIPFVLTEESCESYFTQLDTLAELTGSAYRAGTLRLAPNVPLYLEASALVTGRDYRGLSRDGKAVTDRALMEQARLFLSYLHDFGKVLQLYKEETHSLDAKRLCNLLAGTYGHFAKFCHEGAKHARRIQYDSDYALVETHRKSTVLFIDALFTLVQKNSSSRDEIEKALETREENYCSQLPLLALYHLRLTEGEVPEIFKSIEEELSSLDIEEKDLEQLYKRIVDPGEENGPVSEKWKKGADLLGKLRGKENQLLTGIMRLAVDQTVKALAVRKAAPLSYPLLAAALLREEAIASPFLKNPLVPETLSLPDTLRQFSLEELAAAPEGSPQEKAVEAAHLILRPELFGPLPNYHLL